MPTDVIAATLTAPGSPLEHQTLVLDDPLDHEVVIRTERVGLCHSDLHYAAGSLDIQLPAVLGHEVAGIVEAAGVAVTAVAPGDRVVATVTPACGRCAQCLRGRPTQCRRADVVRARPRPRLSQTSGEPVESLGGIGAFATHFLASELSLAVVDDSLPSEVACLLGCCISTGVGAVVHGTTIGPEDAVLVVGCGGVGIAAVQGARLAGAREIVAVDTSRSKLDLARRFGATAGVEAAPDSAETLEQLAEIIPNGFTHALEAVGQPQTAELAFRALAPGGTATVLGLMRPGSEIKIPADELIYGDRSIQGAYMGANRFLSDVGMFCDHYRRGALDLDGMVTQVVPFEKINDGLADMSSPSTIRVVADLSGVTT